MATLKLNNVPVITEAAGVAQMANTLKFPAGHVLQVVSTSTNTAIVNTTDNHNIDLMSVAITPVSTSSKVFIYLDIFHGNENPNGGWTLFRNSTAIGAAASQHGSSVGSFLTYDDVPGGSVYSMHHFSFNYLDSPALTSAITYKVATSSKTTTYFNIAVNAAQGFSTSSITAMEVAG